MRGDHFGQRNTDQSYRMLAGLRGYFEVGYVFNRDLVFRNISPNNFGLLQLPRDICRRHSAPTEANKRDFDRTRFSGGDVQVVICVDLREQIHRCLKVRESAVFV